MQDVKCQTGSSLCISCCGWVVSKQLLVCFPLFFHPCHGLYFFWVVVVVVAALQKMSVLPLLVGGEAFHWAQNHIACFKASAASQRAVIGLNAVDAPHVIHCRPSYAESGPFSR